MTNQRIPAEVFPPGDFVREELEARGWTQEVLAEVMGRPGRLISEIIAGKRAITPETARGLAAAFGTDATFWANLDAAYRVKQVKHADEEVARRSAIYSYAPVREMIKRGWVTPSENVSVLEERVKDFFNVKSLYEQPSFACASKATAGPATSAQMAWLFRVKHVATKVKVRGKYTEKALRVAIDQLATLRSSPPSIQGVPAILAKAGLPLLYVESLPGAKIDGVCFWFDKATPVIAMSLRHDRIDNYWFVLRHELEHVLHRHGQGSPILDTELDGERAGTGPSVAEDERVANGAAAAWCIPQADLVALISQRGAALSDIDVTAFAADHKIHPGLVAGQIQYQTQRYDRFRKHLVKVREFAFLDAVVDGWGNVAKT